MTKQVGIGDDVYRELEKMKGRGDSFTTVIRRLIQENSKKSETERKREKITNEFTNISENLQPVIGERGTVILEILRVFFVRTIGDKGRIEKYGKVYEDLLPILSKRW